MGRNECSVLVENVAKAPKGWGSGGALKQALYLGMPCTLNRSHLHYYFYLQRKIRQSYFACVSLFGYTGRPPLECLDDLQLQPAARSWHLPQIMVSVLDNLGESLKASELVCENFLTLREIGVYSLL